MQKYLYPIFFLALTANICPAQQLPEGYILQYQQSFSGSKSLADFNVGNPESWGIFKDANNFYLHFAGLPSTGDSPLPGNMAILNDRIFGDFILEANVMPETDTLGFGEVCIFLGVKDRSQFYCVQLANRCDSIHHGIFVVKSAQPRRLTPVNDQPVIWKTNKWYKIRLERDIVRRTIMVFLGDMKHPVLQVKDYELIMGSVGFGSFIGAGRIDNIRIWAPTVITI